MGAVFFQTLTSMGKSLQNRNLWLTLSYIFTFVLHIEAWLLGCVRYNESTIYDKFYELIGNFYINF